MGGIQTPFQAPSCNAHAERFVRSLRVECLNQVVVLGEAHLRRTLTEFVAHYHRERNHQGLDDRLIAPECLAPPEANGRPLSQATRWTPALLSSPA
jgi:transposase InsO family protein